MDNLRVSSYMIPVKLEQEEGMYMLIHGYTGLWILFQKTY